MSSAIGFDDDGYVEEQRHAIIELSERVGGRPYPEFGGKIVFDYHATRVLPGHHSHW